MKSEKVFVYGTLRKDFALPLLEQLGDTIRFVGVGKVEGTLYDIGDYPGAVKNSKEPSIIGDVFDVDDSNRVFWILDEYEGSEYSREEVTVKMNNGDEVTAWIYWYNGETKDDLRIKGSDYLEYLKSKKDGFV